MSDFLIVCLTKIIFDKEFSGNLNIRRGRKKATRDREREKREFEEMERLSRPKNGLQLFCQFNLCFSFFKLSIVYKNSFTTSV